jgi:DNA-binding NarL/FixJ family response regulator
VEKQVYRILVVDDWEPWRRFVTSTLQEEPGLLAVGEASDGLAAVLMAQELQPDLILLDIGLPELNGLEVARRIRRQSPTPKILFCSENSSADIVEEALATGARGYVLKSDAASDLMPAVTSVLGGVRFVSRRFAGHDFADSLKEAISS